MPKKMKPMRVALAVLITVVLAGAVIIGCAPKEEEGAPEVFNAVQAHGYLETYSRGRVANMLEAYWEEATDGRVQVLTFHASTLYKQAAAISACKKGDIEIATASSFSLSHDEPRWTILFIDSYLFDDRDHYMRFLHSEKGGGALAKILEEESVTGILWYDPIPNAELSSAWVTTKPITKVADWQGMKLRIPGGPYGPPLSRLLGFSAVALSGGEVAGAMELGVIDGYRSSLEFAVSYSLYKGYGLLLKNWAISPVIVHVPWWNSLPADIREKLEEANKKIEYDFAYKDWAGRSEALVLKCREQGMVVTEGLSEAEGMKMRQIALQVLAELNDPAVSPTLNELVAEMERTR